MDMTQWIKFVDPKILILVAFLYIIGMLIKQTEKIKSKYIPLILWVIGLAMSIIFYALEGGFTADIVFNGVIQGTFVTALAVWGNQVFKQLTTK